MFSDPVTGTPYSFLNHVLNFIVSPSATATQLNECFCDDLTEALALPLCVCADWSRASLPRVDVYKKVNVSELCQQLGIHSLCQLKCQSDISGLFYTIQVELNVEEGSVCTRFLTPAEVFEQCTDNKLCEHSPTTTRNDFSDELIPLIIQSLITGLSLHTMSDWRMHHVLEISSWNQKQQSAFLARRRLYEWPSKTVLQHLVKLPLALMTPKNGATPNKHQFCVSYHNCLTVLARESLSQIHKQCYFLLNMALKFVSAKVSCFSFGKVLKNLLFFALEETPTSFWKSENVGKCFLFLIDRLIHCLVNGMLPCYFEPSINLLDNLKTESHAELARRVVWLRQHPIEALVKGCTAFQFLHIPLGVPLRHLVHHSLELVNSNEFYHQIEQELPNKIASDNLFSTVLFLEEFFFTNCAVWRNVHLASALNSFCNFCGKLVGNAEGELVYFWCLTTNFLNYKADRFESLPDPLLMIFLETGGKTYLTNVDRFEVLSDLAQCYAENKSQDTLSMSNMTCLSALFTFLALPDHGKSAAEKMAASAKAQQLFERAYNLNSGNVVCLVKLAAYLLITGQHAAALDICKEAYNMCKFDVREKQRITFYKPECVLLDRFLRCDFESTITANNEISYLAQSCVMYFLLQAFLACDKFNEAEQILLRLRQCEGDQPCNLLGYAYLALEKYDEAFEVFKKIIASCPENVAAHNSLELCTALLLSISIEPKNEQF